MDLYYEICLKKYIEYPVSGGGGPLLWDLFFSQIRFVSGGALSPLYTFLWVKQVDLLQKAISMFKPWKCKVSPQKIDALLKPLLIEKHITQPIFKGVPHEWPRSPVCNCLDGNVFCTRTFGASCFLIEKDNQLKVDSNELKGN